jgi:Ca2+-binding RTX toxin-like protein
MRRAFGFVTLACALAAVVLMASFASAADPIVGGPGDDHLQGGNGPDMVIGLAGDDRLTGNNGPDTVKGGRGDDFVSGGKGPDIVKGGRGDDIVWTGKSGPGDKGYGGRGNDVVNNFGSGDSPGLLDGGPGTDKCRGDEHDTYVSCEIIVIMD